MKIVIPLRLTKRELAALYDNSLIDMNSQVNGVPLKSVMSQIAKYLRKSFPKYLPE